MNLQSLNFIRYTFRIIVFSLFVLLTLGMLNTNAGNGPPPPPPGGSNCCIANGGIGCDDPTCEGIVCAVDDFCCTVAWDGICAGEAFDLCGGLCTGGGDNCQAVPIPPDTEEDGEIIPDGINLQTTGGCKLDIVLGDGCASVSGPGINCGEDCDQVFSMETIGIYTVIPEDEFEFVGWESFPECVGTNPTLTIDVDHSFTCTANCQPISGGSGNENEIAINVTGSVESDGDSEESFSIGLDPGGAVAKAIETVAQQGGPFQNVLVVINLPEGVIVNSAAVGDDETACRIIGDTQVECTIPELTGETFINLSIFVPDLGGQLLQAQVLITTDTVPGQTLEQFLNITAGSAADGGGTSTGTGGCTLADAGGSKKALLLFALLPAVVFFRRLRKK